MALTLNIDFNKWIASLPASLQALATSLAPGLLAVFTDIKELQAWGVLLMGLGTKDAALQALADKLDAAGATVAFMSDDDAFAQAGNDALARKNAVMDILNS